MSVLERDVRVGKTIFHQWCINIDEISKQLETVSARLAIQYGFSIALHRTVVLRAQDNA